MTDRYQKERSKASIVAPTWKLRNRSADPIAPPIIKRKTFIIINLVCFPRARLRPGEMVNDLGFQFNWPTQTVSRNEHRFPRTCVSLLLGIQIGNTLDTHSQRVA